MFWKFSAPEASAGSARRLVPRQCNLETSIGAYFSWLAIFFAGQLAQIAHSQTLGGGIANWAIRSRIAANNR